MVSFPIRSHVFIAATLFVLIVVSTVKGNDDNPPFLDNICKGVECGKGRCEADASHPFNFKCDCDDGWKQTHLDTDDHLEFLPCVIPNCTVTYSCMTAPPPTPTPMTPPNTSFVNPCNWMYCGEGTCTRNGTLGHTCQCKSGYSNLLNVPAFPCYPDCAINSESCRRLIGAAAATPTGSNPSTSPTTTTAAASDTNSASVFDQGPLKLTGVAILLASTAMMLWK